MIRIKNCYIRCFGKSHCVVYITCFKTFVCRAGYRYCSVSFRHYVNILPVIFACTFTVIQNICIKIWVGYIHYCSYSFFNNFNRLPAHRYVYIYRMVVFCHFKGNSFLIVYSIRVTQRLPHVEYLPNHKKCI